MDITYCTLRTAIQPNMAGLIQSKRKRDIFRRRKSGIVSWQNGLGSAVVDLSPDAQDQQPAIKVPGCGRPIFYTR